MILPTGFSFANSGARRQVLGVYAQREAAYHRKFCASLRLEAMASVSVPDARIGSQRGRQLGGVIQGDS
jgi:hypothetical protein